MTQPTIAIIGAGNMGSCLAGGLIADNYPIQNIWLTDASIEKLKQLEQRLGVHVTQNNEQIAQLVDVVLFAVKPQSMAEVVKNLKTAIQTRKPLVISIAAGIRSDSIQKWLGGKIAIVRVMPNTPALIGCGASGLYANSFVSQEQHNLAESIMRAMGTVVWVESEEKIDTVTALSGSGPAYIFLVIEAMQQAGEKLGLASETARLLALQTAYGAARMALDNEKNVKELRMQVTSPGGTTEQAINVLEKGKIFELFEQALKAANKRSEELGKMFDK